MVVARSKFGMVTHVGEGEAPFLEGQIWPLSQGVGPQHPPEIFGTCQHGMTNSNHIFIVIKQDERKILLGRPHSCPGEKKFCDTVANLLVSS